MALTNSDVLRLRNRINALSNRVNTFYSGLNGQAPSASQEEAIRQEAVNASNQFLEVARIIEIAQQQARLTAELSEYRS